MTDKLDWKNLTEQLQELSSEIARNWDLLSEDDVRAAKGNPEVLAAKIAARYGISKEVALKKLQVMASGVTPNIPKSFGSTLEKSAKSTLKSSTSKVSAPNKLVSTSVEKQAKGTLKASSGKSASMPKKFGSATGTATQDTAPEVNDEIELMTSKLQASFGISKEQARQQIEELKAAKAAGKLKPKAGTAKPKASPPTADAGLTGLNLESLAGGLGALFGMGDAQGGSNAQQPAGGDPLSGLLGILGGQGLGVSGGNLEGIAGQLMDQLGIEPEDAIEKVLDWVKNLK